MGKRLVRDPPMDRRSCYYFHMPSKEPKPEFRYPSAETTKLEQFMVLLNRTRMFDIQIPAWPGKLKQVGL